MVKLMSRLIFQLAAISVISSVLRMALPEHKIKKYVTFLTGLVVMLCVFSTLFAFTNTETNPFLIDESLLAIDEQKQRQYTKQEQALVEVCIGTEIKQELEEFMTANGYHLQVNQVVPHFYADDETKNKIETIEVIISNQSVIDNKELKDIQKYIAEKYLIAMNQICYYKEEN